MWDLISWRQTAFTRFWEEGYLTDVRFLCRNGSVNAHRLVLAATSSFWKQLLLDKDSVDEQEIIHIPGLEVAVLEELLQFLYTGNSLLNFSAKHVNAFESLLPDFRVLNVDQSENLIDVASDPQYVYSSNPTAHRIQEIYVDMGKENQDPVGLPKDDDDDFMNDEEFQVNTKPSSNSKSLSQFGHECSECLKTFRYAKDLKKHMRIHSGEAPYGCSVCRKYFRNRSNLYKHLRENHNLSNVKEYVIDQDGVSEVAKQQKIAETLDINALIQNAPQVDHDSRGRPLYECGVCEKKFRKKILESHVPIHSGNPTHNCNLCGKGFFSTPGLNKHYILEHEEGNSNIDTGEKIYRCSSCPMKFKSEEDRVTHSIERHDDSVKEKVRCKVCGKHFTSISNLYAHQKTIHNMKVGRDKEFSCRYCNKSFKGKVQLTRHKLSSHKGESEELCSICGKKFLTEDQLSRHIAIHDLRPRPLQCPFCPKTYFRKDVLKLHEKVHTDPIPCDICGKKFATDRQVESHKKHLHEEKQFACRSCDKYFALESQLTQHMQIHLMGVRSYSCEECGQSFSTRNLLKAHMSCHPGKYPLQCSRCGKGFMTGSQLHKHVENVHHPKQASSLECQHCGKSTSIKNIYGLKRHLMKHKCLLVTSNLECVYCNKNLETYNELKRHIRINESKRIHKCNACDRRFRTPQELSTHKVVHTGQKPYQCELCLEGFTQQSSLNAHLQRHERNQVQSSYPCDICGKVTKTLGALTIHRRTHQGLEKPMPTVEEEVITYTVDPVTSLETLEHVPDDEALTYRIQIIDSTLE